MEWSDGSAVGNDGDSERNAADFLTLDQVSPFVNSRGSDPFFE